jgi:hypothetical protein
VYSTAVRGCEADDVVFENSGGKSKAPSYRIRPALLAASTLLFIFDRPILIVVPGKQRKDK